VEAAGRVLRILKARAQLIDDVMLRSRTDAKR